MACAFRFPGGTPLVLAALAFVASGCHVAPRKELEDCHRVSQTLRSENAALKDQMLALRSQNQDYSERAVDDARRLAQLESSNQQLETSVQAYQDERTRLEAAYQELRASLPRSMQPLSSNQLDGMPPLETAEHSRQASPRTKPPRRQEHDPEIEQVSAPAAPKAAAPARLKKAARDQDTWMPSKAVGSTGRSDIDSSSTPSDP